MSQLASGAILKHLPCFLKGVRILTKNQLGYCELYAAIRILSAEKWSKFIYRLEK